MAIIKIFDFRGGHIWDGNYLQKEMTPQKALESALKMRENEIKGEFFIGEKGCVEFDTSRIECQACRFNSERLFMVSKERR